MALPQSAVSELLEAFRAGDGVDLVRESVRIVMQELIEAEATEQIGAARYERTEDRVAERNGSRPKLLATKAGDVELRIPKLRKGSFFPSILEPRRRIDQALYAVVMEAYVHGISTRSVDDLVVALGADSGISKSEVSRICEQLDESVGAFRTRPLDHIAFPYVYLDATYLNVRNQTSQVVSMAVVVATGIAADGSREVLGPDVGDSEDETFWRGFLTSLKQRGLHEAIHDARKNIKRIRALYRLIASDIEDFQKAENARLRDIGRALSHLRDTAVLAETADYLEQETEQKETRSAIRRLGRAAKKRRDRIADTHVGSTGSHRDSSSRLWLDGRATRPADW